jgi:hypothetical protein
MSDLCRLIWSTIIGLVQSRAALHAEIVVLRHQLNVPRRKSRKRVAFSNIDRPLFAGLYCFSPKVLEALKILKPETVLRWHRSGFRAYWRWKRRLSRRLALTQLGPLIPFRLSREQDLIPVPSNDAALANINVPQQGQHRVPIRHYNDLKCGSMFDKETFEDL